MDDPLKFSDRRGATVAERFRKLLLKLQPEVLICRGNGHRPGSVFYTNYPTEGLYTVTRHENGETFGKLSIPTDFGYPDDDCRGLITSQILNKERTFRRDPNDGHWRLG